MRSLLDVDCLTISEIEDIFRVAEGYSEFSDNNLQINGCLVNVFFEHSTRTRTSFEYAAKSLGLQVINWDINLSAVHKGESDENTIITLAAMNPDFVVIRHKNSGVINKFREIINTSIINAGDGCHAHPTQALVDSYTIKQHIGDVRGVKILLCGDILHSRVARSNIRLLKRLGAKISVVAPNSLLPSELLCDREIKVYTSLLDAIQSQDVVMVLRLQLERMNDFCLPSLQEYKRYYELNLKVLSYAKNDLIIMHPGPVNQGVEISVEIMQEYPQCYILNQVSNGIKVRRAILQTLYANFLSAS